MFWDIVSNIFSVSSLLMMCIGVLAGIIIGALPGLNTVFAIAVLLPFTFGMSSTAGMYLLLGAFCGGLFGGSISAILINTPGTPAACMTTLDGYPLAQKGLAGNALRCAVIASGFGGIFSSFVLIFLAPTIARASMNFASPEFFALCVFGLSTVISIAGNQVLKGIIMVSIGLLISSVGIDITDGTRRFMFSSMNLMAGISPIVVMLGVYAFSEVLTKCVKRSSLFTKIETTVEFHKTTIRIRDILKYWKTLLKSSVIGAVIGAIPGTGGVIAATLSYNEAKRASKTPEEFGQGSYEGVIASECGNNAVSGGTLIPALTLGIPGDATVAILLGALTMQGITPGMALFTEDKTWVYAIMIGLLVINIIMILQGVLFTNFFASVAKVPEVIQLPCIVVLCVVGSFAISGAHFNILLMIVFGILAYILKKLDFPLTPLIISLVLGQMMEANLRRSLQLSGGSYAIFFTRPVSCTIMVIALLILFSPVIKKLVQKIKARKTK